MSQRFSRFFATFLLAISAFAMLSVSFDAEARRMGGGRSFGKQSSNVSKQRPAVTPPTATQRSATAPAAAAGATAGAAGAAAKSGMSRWLGPLAGIAAGLGIAALLSSMGLSGAFLEIISNLVMIGLAVFAVMFLIRRFRGAGAKPAMQHAGASPMQRQNTQDSQPQQPWRQADTPFAGAASAPAAAAATAAPAAPVDPSWFIPSDFDTGAFLANAKSQFHTIQAVWDSGDTDKLHSYLTDDLIAEMQQNSPVRAEGSKTEVLLLNAELLGIEEVAGGHLASVRYSGMLREEPQAEAFRFEEVWNLYKADNAGWLLAGIQQIPVDQAS
ncbi:Tim44 domain-containing protein [Alcaligenaceae bacterium]|nr:Tim44 domain-containing protein [Alcaligenaceae bacterium]